MVYYKRGSKRRTPVRTRPLRSVQRPIIIQQQHSPHVYWLLAIVAIAAAVGWLLWWKNTQRTDTIARQIRGEYTPSEIALISGHKEISQPPSTMVPSRSLTSSLTSKERKVARKSNLEVDSVTRAKATLTGKTTGGKASLSGTVLDWWDPYRRFHLWGNVAQPESLQFTYNQRFSIRGVVLRQKDGALRIQTLHLYELDSEDNQIGEAVVDVDKSSFYFAPPAPSEAPAQHWLVCLGTGGTIMGTYLPVYKFGGQVGMGVSVGQSFNGDTFVGATTMLFPPRWTKSGVGIGLSAGWSKDKHTDYKLQVAWAFDKLF